nr:molybdopterin molybdenumtransferase MoeA [Rhodoferax sp.]
MSTPPVRKPLMPLETALAQLLGALDGRILATELVSTFEADGRVLAQEVVSALQVPPQDNSSMDGYALRVSDLAPGAVLPVSQRIAAGAS